MLVKFSDIWDDFFNYPIEFNKSKFPAINIEDQKDKYIFSLASPGMDKKNFDLKIEGNTLIISGKKEEKVEKKEKKFTRKEFSSESFIRSFTLPEHINFNAVKAEYKGGILEIILPKKEGNGDQYKKIEIK